MASKKTTKKPAARKKVPAGAVKKKATRKSAKPAVKVDARASKMRPAPPKTTPVPVKRRSADAVVPVGGRSVIQQKGAQVAEKLAQNIVFGLDPFELFCAYHLGITAQNTYVFQNVHDVAKRLGTNAGQVRQALQNYGMDPDAVINSRFNMASAQVDIQVSPPGVDLKTLGRMHYEEFLGSPQKGRNWQKELAEDEAANAETFSRPPKARA